MPDRGHFDVADRTAEYIGLFLKKAVEQRIPETADCSRPVALKNSIFATDGLPNAGEPEKTSRKGEVRTARLARQPRRSRPAPYSQYKGDKHDAFWYFDGEMAELTEAIYRQDHDLLPQYVSFMQAGEPVPYNPASHVTLSARFLPEADGGDIQAESSLYR